MLKEAGNKSGGRTFRDLEILERMRVSLRKTKYRNLVEYTLNDQVASKLR